MRIIEVYLELKKHAHYLIIGKPISVYTDGHEIIMVCEAHQGDTDIGCELYMFTEKTYLSEEEAKGLIFLGTVYPQDMRAIHIYYRLEAVKDYTRVLEPMPQEFALKTNLNAYAKTEQKEQEDLEFSH